MTTREDLLAQIRVVQEDARRTLAVAGTLVELVAALPIPEAAEPLPRCPVCELPTSERKMEAHLANVHGVEAEATPA